MPPPPTRSQPERRNQGNACRSPVSGRRVSTTTWVSVGVPLGNLNVAWYGAAANTVERLIPETTCPWRSHAIHMVAVTQIRYRHSPGRAYYDKKLAEGKTGKEALRALKRQISDAIFACLQTDAGPAAACAKSPGGQPGNHSSSRAAGSHPDHRLFGQATPGPATHPTTPAGADAAAPFPAPLPSRASGRTGQGPGAARPRSGARRASSTRPRASR